MDRILLLDGHSMAYRAFYALPVENFATSTGQATNAIYGFLSMLINVLRDEKPSHVLVAFDVSRKSFRTEQFPEYKANRAASPAEFAGQVELIKEMMAALGIPAVQAEGYEADDVIATLTAAAEHRGDQVLIVSGDRDSFQLVTDAVTVLYPRKGVSDLARMTPAAVEEKFGLTPEQYPDFAALRGDPSDNLPGIPGVGDKTAAKWIQQYGSLAGLVDHVDEVPGKAGEALRSALPQVLLNRDLTHLRRDVPIEVAPEDGRLAGWDRPRVDALLEALEFRALRDRLWAIDPEPRAPERPLSKGPEVLARGVPEGEVEAALEGLQGPVSIVCAGSWGAGTGALSGAGLALPGATALDLDLGTSQAQERFAAWTARTDVQVTMHDAKGPLLALMAAGGGLGHLVMDTAIAAYLAAPGARSFDLPDVAERVLGEAIAGPDGTLFGDGRALAAEADTVARLGAALHALLEEQGQLGLLADVELPLVPVLARMERAGIAVDASALAGLSAEFAADMRAAEERAHQLAGRPFNLGSPKQLQEILFVERGLPKTKKIKTGYTTDAEALQGLFVATGDPLLEQMLAWRDRSKLRQTVDGLLPLIDADGRIHTTFNQTVAATGRLSSTDPNLQNIPVRTEAGQRIRSCFIAGPDYAALLTADYSQIEMRIMAHVSEDEGLIDAFNSGEDLHTTVASRVFDVRPDQVDAEMRRRIKAMSYGLAYGLSAYGLSQQLGIGAGEARLLMDEYFKRFGGVRDYLAGIVERARKDGFTETMLGRRRYLPDLTSDNRQRREMAERMALNAPIQGTAADLIKIAMLRVDRELVARGARSRLLLQVHDELVLEIAPGEESSIPDLVKEAMAGAASLAVPLDVSIGLGRTWQEAAH